VSGYSDGTFRPFNNVTRAQAIKIIVVGEQWPLYSPPRPTFIDVFPTDWHYQYIETANFNGIIAGYGDGTFRPQNQITRGQLSKVIVLASLWSLLDPEVPTFIDVPRGSTFYAYIETAYAHQIISGYGDGSFRPQLNATRGQYCKMLYVALNP
jgi:S-layer homology domain